jgi:hypothetical protein
MHFSHQDPHHDWWSEDTSGVKLVSSVGLCKRNIFLCTTIELVSVTVERLLKIARLANKTTCH